MLYRPPPIEIGPGWLFTASPISRRLVGAITCCTCIGFSCVMSLTMVSANAAFVGVSDARQMANSTVHLANARDRICRAPHLARRRLGITAASLPSARTSV
jgi:hypothetical protein